MRICEEIDVAKVFFLKKSTLSTGYTMRVSLLSLSVS